MGPSIVEPKTSHCSQGKSMKAPVEARTDLTKPILNMIMSLYSGLIKEEIHYLEIVDSECLDTQVTRGHRITQRFSQNKQNSIAEKKPSYVTTRRKIHITKAFSLGWNLLYWESQNTKVTKTQWSSITFLHINVISPWKRGMEIPMKNEDEFSN